MADSKQRGSIIYLERVTVDFDGFKALRNLNFFVDYNELRGEKHAAGCDLRKGEARLWACDLRNGYGPGWSPGA